VESWMHCFDACLNGAGRCRFFVSFGNDSREVY